MKSHLLKIQNYLQLIQIHGPAQFIFKKINK